MPKQNWHLAQNIARPNKLGLKPQDQLIQLDLSQKKKNHHLDLHPFKTLHLTPNNKKNNTNSPRKPTYFAPEKMENSFQVR